ncbi:MAG: TfoX/Sxy family protein [Chitinophagales bacterium]
MAYDEYLADRIRRVFEEMKVPFEEKRMFGGLCMMVDDKMCCGLLFDKNKHTDFLMARIGEERSAEAMKKVGCHPMDFTGRPMKGYVFITPDGFDTDEELFYWIKLCIDYNPLAKASKKKTKSI